MYKNILPVATAALLSTADARINYGKCPEVSYMQDFKTAGYSGKWYEIVRDSTNPMTLTTECVTKEFSPVKEDESMDLYFRGFYQAI